MKTSINKRKLKEKKEVIKAKKDNLKLRKKLNELQTFVSKKYKNDVYNDRTYNGIIPQHVSKRLKAKHPSKSKTPRSMMRKDELNFMNLPSNERNARANTAADFYPITSRVSESLSNLTPNYFAMNKVQLKENLKSYDSTDKHRLKPVDEQPQVAGANNGSISQAKFKINPSPYKRREKSIDELIQHLQQRIDEIEIIEAAALKKHQYGVRQKPKPSKKKKAKARSLSPKGTPKSSKKVIVAPPFIKNQIMKSISKNEEKFHPNKARKPSKGQGTSRNKKTNITSIERETLGFNNTPQHMGGRAGARNNAETRPLKIKSISTIKDKSTKKPKRKASSTVKKKTKKVPQSKIVKVLKEKVEDVKNIRNEIYKRAAVVIQRWFRVASAQRLERQRRLEQEKQEKAVSNYHASPHNKDIQSLESSQDDEVMEKRVIIDIHTENKDENYRQVKTKKKSKHNFSFGNNAKGEEVHDDALAGEGENGKFNEVKIVCIGDSKDSDFERYKRKKRENQDYRFKKKGRNIFDSDKGEEAEEAFDYFDMKSYNENYEIINYDLKRKHKNKKYIRAVNNEEEKKLEFSSHIDNSYARPESQQSSNFSDREDR